MKMDIPEESRANEREQMANRETKRIRQISVKNLFGMFNHTIPLNLNERITIIHGPSGFGKTIIFKLLSEIFSQSDLGQTLSRDNAALRLTPFDEFCVDFDDDSGLRVVRASKTVPAEGKNDSQEGISVDLQLTFYEVGSSTNKPFTFTFSPPSPFSLSFPTPRSSLQIMIGTIKQSTSIETIMPIIEQIEPDIIEKLILHHHPSKGEKPEPKWLKKVRSTISVRFIEVQRLLNLARVDGGGYRLPPLTEPTVAVYSKEVVEAIKEKTAEYAEKSQERDKAFLRTVMDSSTQQKHVTVDELRRKVADLEKKRSRLMSFDLLTQDNEPAFKPDFQVSEQMDSITKRMVSVYVRDTEEKLQVFDELADKLETLQTIINKRFLYKKMSISKAQGFVFITKQGTVVPLESLSSGEQHQLVLFYELLFKAKPGSLILIDEPELSLHVVWQKQFLEDIQEVTLLRDIDVLIATHSPSIISNHWELTVQLEGPHE